MAQLKMFLEEALLEKCLPPAVPEGFTLRSLREGDEEKYADLLFSAGFQKWDSAAVEKAKNKCLKDGIYLLVENSTGKFAACAYCNKGPVPGEESGGILGMVAVSPDFRGRHFARIVCMAVMNRFREESYKRICLFTDETRIPALKTYLKLGWKPIFLSEENKALWQEVYKITGYAF